MLWFSWKPKIVGRSMFGWLRNCFSGSLSWHEMASTNFLSILCMSYGNIMVVNLGSLMIFLNKNKPLHMIAQFLLFMLSSNQKWTFSSVICIMKDFWIKELLILPKWSFSSDRRIALAISNKALQHLWVFVLFSMLC